MDWHFEPDPALNLDREFDVIIVGAGAAGCALARGLSMSSLSVLLLDMGGAGHADARVRDGARWKETLRSPIDQALRTTEQRGLLDGATGAPGRVVVANQGTTLGGSTALNATFWVRGNPSDYECWAARGCAGWSHADMLPALRDIERWRRDDDDGDAASGARRGASGPVGVARDLCRGDAAYAALLDVAVRECGFRATEDYNGADGRGDERGADERGADDRIGYMQFNVDAATGERHDAYSAFVRPVLHRPNLVVATRARALRVVFAPPASAGDETGGAAAPPPRACVGVEVEWAAAKSDADAAPPAAADGAPPPPPPPPRPERRLLRARAEVVLCAGALRTPQLLMLSGVGRADELERHGVGVVAPSAEVGENLQARFGSLSSHRARRVNPRICRGVPPFERWAIPPRRRSLMRRELTFFGLPRRRIIRLSRSSASRRCAPTAPTRATRARPGST